MSPVLDLESILRQAATVAGWTRVLHRCAWCNHFFNERGEHHIAVPIADDAVVTTDGLCRACGIRALLDISTRRRRPRAA